MRHANCRFSVSQARAKYLQGRTTPENSNPEIPAPAEAEPEPLNPPTPINTSTTDVIHIGPRGVATRWMPMVARCTSRPAEVVQTHKLDDKLS